VVIRELRAGEAGSATALWEETGLTRPWNDPVADFHLALDSPASTILGGFDGDLLIATAMVGHDGHRGWVYYLAVAPARQREGHGRALMAACEQWLVARRVPKLNLMIRASNEEAIGFYAALEYATEDRLVMSKRLGVTNVTSRL
jgi:ribosomal protein S18 acetylase RimI-like enzyme